MGNQSYFLNTEVGIRNTEETRINPVTEEKAEQLRVLLAQVYNAVDELEIKADSINLNTDELETKIQSVKDQLDVLLSTRASEITSQEIREAIGQESGTTVLTKLQEVVDNLHDLATDIDGKLQVSVSPSAQNITMQLRFDENHTSVNSGEWQEVLEYEIPTGYNFNAIQFNAISNVANEAARAVNKTLKGSFDCSTDTFTDGNTIAFPRFCSSIYLLVTELIGSANNDIITVTYTNQDGISGRTATVTIPKSSLVGTRLEILLQDSDYGILDITNVTHSAIGQAGSFEIYGYIELFYLTLNDSGIQYESPPSSLGGLVLLEGSKIYLQYLSSSAVNNKRRVNLMGVLIPKT